MFSDSTIARERRLAAARSPGSLRAAAFAAGLLLAGAALAPAQAEAPPADSRWLPWLGCWSAVAEPLPGQAAAPEQEPVVCVHASGAGVVVRTAGAGATVPELRIVADGQRRPATVSDCSGWESASWSRDGRRVFLHSELKCAGGQTRTSSGVMAILPGDGWMDAQAVDVGAPEPAVRVRRYRAADAAALEQAGLSVADAPTYSLSAETARRAAAARLAPEDVIEATRAVSPRVVEALLMERGQGFEELDGETLVQLADAGVPGEVTDLMIALSNPDRFEVDPASGRIGARVAESYGDDEDPYSRRGRRGGYGGYVGTLGWGSSYGACSRYGYGRYGYDPYGYGYGYGYGRCGYYSPYAFGSPYGYWHRGAPVIIVDGGASGRESSGKMVKGRGYTRQGGDDGSRSSATRRDRDRRSSGTGSHMGIGSSRSTGSTSGGSARAPSSSGSSGSSSGSTRHAKPKGH